VAHIETGQWSETLRRVLLMKGTERVAGELSPEISPVFVLEEDPPDWRYLKGVRMASVSVDLTSGANSGPTLRLRNPLNSTFVATVHAIDVWMTTNDIVAIRIIREDLNLVGGGAAGTPRDTRWQFTSGTGRTSLIPTFNLNLPPLGNDYLRARPSGGALEIHYRDPIVITDGFSLDIGGTTAVAVNLFINVSWTERVFPPLEHA